MNHNQLSSNKILVRPSKKDKATSGTIIIENDEGAIRKYNAVIFKKSDIKKIKVAINEIEEA